MKTSGRSLLSKQIPRLALVLIFPLLSLAGEPGKLTHYDEVLHPDGTVRPHYDGIYQEYKKLTRAQRRELLLKSGTLFQGDNHLNLLPRVLTPSEFSDIKSGVEQRAKALKLFFNDHYSGKKTYLKNQVLNEEFVNQIIARHGDQEWGTKIPEEAISWLYGPDILRLPNGRFAVVEDNFGYIGGLGDLEKAPESLFKLMPQYKRYLDIPNPTAFYEQMAARFKERAAKHGGKAVLLQHMSRYFDDNEDFRVRKIMERYGVEWVEMDFAGARHKDAKKRLVTEPDGVYLVRNEGGKVTREKVGFVMTQSSIMDLDSTTPELRRKRLVEVFNSYLEEFRDEADPRVRQLLLDNSLGKPFTIEEAEKLHKKVVEPVWHDYYARKEGTGVPGLVDAVLKGQVGSNYAPGLDFVEDKEFYIAVPELIKYYLGEKPILENIETGSFRAFHASGAGLDEVAFDKVFTHIKDYVVKGVSGMGGAEVWIGPKMTLADIQELKAKVRATPSLFIFQGYLPLSHMDGDLVDLRLMADVGPKVGDILTAKAPWGRASPMKGNGKVNISSGGSETSVFIRYNGVDPICAELLKKAH